MRARVLLLLLCLLATTGLAACGSESGALGGKSPAQILAAGLAAARSQPSVHYLLQSSGGSQRQTISGEAGQDQGVQTVVTGQADVTVEDVVGSAYLQGNAAGLQQAPLDLSAAVASKYAGQWISVAPTDSLYQSILAAITVQGILDQLTPSGDLATTTPGLIAGHEVIGVRGDLPASAGSSIKGTAVLYVSATRPTVPIGFSGQASSNGVSVTDLGAFSRWGQPLHLSAPTGAVPLSSVSGS